MLRPDGRLLPSGSASGEWKGHTGKPIRNVVNIGIGGSDLGPVMAYEALRHYSRRDLTFRFVSNVDGTDFAEAIRDLDPAETLFIVASKTFTTLETMTNARTAREWVLAGARRREAAVAKHFVAVSTNAEEVAKFGIDTDEHVRLLGLGRRPLLDGLGHRPLDDARDRARATSARCWPASTRWTSTSATRRSEQNLPVLLGLLAVWYTDFFGAQTVAVLPYDQYLTRFPAYLQQLTMESNGKHVTLDGVARRLPDRARSSGASPAPTASTPSTSSSTRARGSSPAISSASPQPLNPLGHHHDMLMANVFAQAEALAFGKTAEQVRAEGTPEAARAAPGLPGQPPVQHDPRRAAHPETLGQLVALYEHSVFTQGASGTSTPSTSGAWSWARRWPGDRPRAGGAAASRSCATTAPPTR